MSLTDEGESRLTTDQAFDLLGDGERRRALAALREFEEAVSLDRLAEATAARRDAVTPVEATSDEVTPDQRERVAAMLHHAHLPRFEDAGVATYDPMAGEVELTEAADDLEPYFEVMEEYRESVQSESVRSD
ncbi:hypothetical protein M0R88_17160 [Halorussus gelatinilyticus]|uniref:DUF7344 domain-containing protein n=1 Tax=Halorussus gelatinilyticus TaxID=2937524 RepID=A0A8U0IGM4_9EURY|nr:hypothetical protein [Halorussus gelatinilyticus]UPW00227.1 hypothetical protein M0R88_17160 [Halorussus gelatinilyticus]